MVIKPCVQTLSPSKFNTKSRERLLYTATGLIILVNFSLILWVIPQVIKDTSTEASFDKAASVFWALLAIHLILLVVLIWIIVVSHRGGQIPRTALILPGIILILMSIFLIDSAGAYLERQPDMFCMPLILFICALSDMMAGVIAIMLTTRQPW